MKHAAFVVGLAVLLTATFALAQAATSPAPDSAQGGAQAMMPRDAASKTASHGKISAADFKQQLKQSGLSDQKVTHFQYVMMAQVAPFDPAHVLAIKDELNLTDDQVNKLNAALQQSHDLTRQLLTDDQQKIIQQIQPMTVADATSQLPQSVSTMLMAQAQGRAPAGTPGATAPATPGAAPRGGASSAPGTAAPKTAAPGTAAPGAAAPGAAAPGAAAPGAAGDAGAGAAQR